MQDPFIRLNRILAGFNLNIFSLQFRARGAFTAPFTAIPLRGAFGYALLNACCRFDDNNCSLCPNLQTCAYSVLFDSSPSEQNHASGRFANAPRPYIIQPSERAGKRIKPGDPFSLNLTLFGSSIEHFPSVVTAFAGLGCTEGIGPEKAGFDLEQVTQFVPGDEVVVFRNGISYDLQPPFSFGMIPQLSSARRARIRIETPIDIKVRGARLSGAPPFSTFIESLLRRALLLNHLYCGGEYAEPDTRLLDMALTIGISSANISDRSFSRFSTRQEQTQIKGGITGNITYTGNMAPLIPLLRLGELIGVGRSTTFGMGRYLLEV